MTQTPTPTETERYADSVDRALRLAEIRALATIVGSSAEEETSRKDVK